MHLTAVLEAAMPTCFGTGQSLADPPGAGEGLPPVLCLNLLDVFLSP